jgi:hypothetical protein
MRRGDDEKAALRALVEGSEVEEVDAKRDSVELHATKAA